MKHFKFLYFLIIFLIQFTVTAQTDFSIEKSGIVKTKKTDNTGFALKKPDGGVYVLVYNYKREIQYVNEFDSKMKLRKSTKIRATKDRIVSAVLENGKIKLFAVEVGRGLGKVLVVNFEKKNLEEIIEEAYDLDLDKKAIRKSVAKQDVDFNRVNDKKSNGDIDASLHTFTSDKENFTLIATLHNYAKRGFTIFSDDRPRETSTHTIIRLDKKLNVVDNKEVTLIHKDFKDFKLYKIDYFEDNDTYIFYGKGKKAKNKNRRKEDRELDLMGFETIYVLKGDQKPVMIKLQGEKDLLAVSKALIIDNSISLASLTFSRAYTEEDKIKTGLMVQEFDIQDLKQKGVIINTELDDHSFKSYDFKSPSEGDLRKFDFHTMVKFQNDWVFGIYSYEVGTETMSFGSGQNVRRRFVSSERIKGDFNVFQLDSQNGELIHHYTLKREITRDRRDRIYNVGTYTNSGRFEFWNHGVFSKYREGKFNFIVNARELKKDTDTLTYVNSNLKSDKELLKSKPYLITLDLEKGFEYKPLLKTGTGLNGLMVEKMVKISDNEYITNTPKPKEKSYVKITLD